MSKPTTGTARSTLHRATPPEEIREGMQSIEKRVEALEQENKALRKELAEFHAS